jgi:hypothetical protein
MVSSCDAKYVDLDSVIWNPNLIYRSYGTKTLAGCYSSQYLIESSVIIADTNL